MLFSYGQGEYVEGSKCLEGQILLSEHKLFLKDSTGELAKTYVPLEKIEKIKLSAGRLIVFVRPSILETYQVLFKGEKKLISDLAKDIVEHRGLRKKFLLKEWFDESGSK